MGKQPDKKESQELNSRILLMILDELRYIRNRVDTALGANTDPLAPPPPPNTPVIRDEAPNAEIVEPEIVEAEIVSDNKPEPVASPKPKAAKKPDRPRPQKTQKKAKSPRKPVKPDPPDPKPEQPVTAAAEPAQSQNSESFALPAPSGPDEEAKLFATQKKRIENMMSVAQFTRAEQLAQALLATIPDSNDAEALLETVRRESAAFRTEQQARLFAEFQKWTESRQWTKAQTVGEQLIGKYPASEEGQTVAASMATVRKNAHYEEARKLRDRIRDLIKRKRYSEAVQIAEDLIRRFPKTQVAKQLTSLLPDLRRRNAQFR
ncbi:MAG: hypothetical protein QGG42_14750 [Phycisphaerae bacterium]|jgi:tetratricopeptide (TPR) repeat protein|nr:hypothetical protein [Phycisphaerae bacterium]